MTARPHIRIVAAATSTLIAAALLVSCSSSSSDDATPEPASAVASAAVGAGPADMTALCDQMVADKLSPEDATALAEENGFVARVGTVDGEAQALTMDLREDRFTFDVEGGAVVGCTYG
ncbi:MAG: hypothetical protein IPO93_14760 [Actinobacteria bacterium]|jgi:hypothetical protein|nr:hypothetical protein [Actinomycetota bacterium]